MRMPSCRAHTLTVVAFATCLPAILFVQCVPVMEPLGNTVGEGGSDLVQSQPGSAEVSADALAGVKELGLEADNNEHALGAHTVSEASAEVDAEVNTKGMAQSLTSEKKRAKIEKIYWINLEKDTKRREHMEEQLAKHAFDIKQVRIPAVDSEHFEGSVERSRLMPQGCCLDSDKVKCNQPNKDSALRSCCCDLSHRIGYEHIANEQGDPNAFYLLLEDDVRFEESWLDDAETALADVPSDWDLLRLGFWGDKSDDFVVKDHKRWHLASRIKPDGWTDEHWSGYYGAHAVVLTPAKARALLDNRIIAEPGDFADKFTGFRNTEFHSYALESRPVKNQGNLGSSRLNEGPNNNNLVEKVEKDEVKLAVDAQEKEYKLAGDE